MIHAKLISAAAVLTAAGAFSLAHANPSEHFNKIDTNADGVVNEAEFVAYKTANYDYSAEEAAEKFSKIAGDDGQLTLVEFGTALEKDHRRNCSKTDQDA